MKVKAKDKPMPPALFVLLMLLLLAIEIYYVSSAVMELFRSDFVNLMTTIDFIFWCTLAIMMLFRIKVLENDRSKMTGVFAHIKQVRDGRIPRP